MKYSDAWRELKEYLEAEYEASRGLQQTVLNKVLEAIDELEMKHE